MENKEINNISHISMVKAEVEKLREKVSLEKAKIIKMKMQYETVSGQHQEESRLRPDTLNKLSTTCKMTDILEEYVERLKEALSRCKADQSGLSKAFQESEQVVRDLLQKNKEADEKNRQVIEALQDKEAQVAELRQKLEAFKCKEELLANINELQRNLDLAKFDLEKKEQTLSNIMERKRLIQAFNKKGDEMNSTMKKLEKDFKEAEEIKLLLKKELDNQQQIAKSKCEHNNSLQQKLELLMEQKANLDASIRELKYQLLENSNSSEKQQYQIAKIMGEKKKLLKTMKQNEQLLSSHKEEIKVFKQQITTIEIEKCEVISDMKKAMEDLRQQKYEVENEYQKYRETSENKEKEFMRVIEARDKEMDSKTSVIKHLISDLKTGTDVRSKLAMTIQKYKKEIDDMTEKEKKSIENIIRLETEIKNKDQMWSEKLKFVIENNRIEKPFASSTPTLHQNEDSLNLPSLDDGMKKDSLDISGTSRRFFAISNKQSGSEPLTQGPVSSLLRDNVAPAPSQGRQKPRTLHGFEVEAQHPHNQGPKNAKTYDAKFFKTKQGEIKRKKFK